MLQATRGIVLKTVKYSESSIIAKIYTEQFGLRSYIVKGLAGKSKSNKKALFQGLNLLNMVVYEKQGANLQNIKEIEHAFVFGKIPYDIRKSSIAMFINEVLYKSLLEESENGELFNFLYSSITSLDQSEKLIIEFHIRFLIAFSKYLGLMPQNNYSETNNIFDLQEGVFVSDQPLHSNFLNVNSSSMFSRALSNKAQQICKSQAGRNELLEKIILYYSLHLPTFGDLKSHTILKQVLND